MQRFDVHRATSLQRSLLIARRTSQFRSIATRACVSLMVYYTPENTQANRLSAFTNTEGVRIFGLILSDTASW